MIVFNKWIAKLLKIHSWLLHTSMSHLLQIIASKLKTVLSNIIKLNQSKHSRTLAWIIPWTEECGGLQSMGS